MKTLKFLVIISLLSSCGGDDEPLQQYNIQLIDGFTETPLANVPMGFFYNIGAQGISSTTGITDQDGFVTMNLNVTMDSIQSIITEHPYLDESFIFQTINIDKNDYVLYELEQDTAIRIVRSVLAEDNLIIAKAYEALEVDCLIVDESPDRTEEQFVFYDIKQFHPNFSFEEYGSALKVFPISGQDTAVQGLFLAAEADYRVDYFVTILADSFTGELDTIFQSSVDFNYASTLPDLKVVARF
jgi:hypothetical protein